MYHLHICAETCYPCECYLTCCTLRPVNPDASSFEPERLTGVWYPEPLRQLWDHHCRVLGPKEGWWENIKGEGGETTQLLLLLLLLGLLAMQRWGGCRGWLLLSHTCGLPQCSGGVSGGSKCTQCVSLKMVQIVQLPVNSDIMKGSIKKKNLEISQISYITSLMSSLCQKKCKFVRRLLNILSCHAAPGIWGDMDTFQAPLR